MSGSVAFVTGGAGGIGSATVRELARRGYAVAITDFGNADDAAVLAREVGGIAIDVDVADPVAIAQAVKETENELGPIGVAVCCAGIDIDRSLELTDDSLWDRFLHVLLGGCVNVIAAVRPGMQDRGYRVDCHGVFGACPHRRGSACRLCSGKGGDPRADTRHGLRARAIRHTGQLGGSRPDRHRDADRAVAC